MSDENKDPELQTWIDPELEARVVAWVLGEASEFEAAELTRIVAEKPELAIFKRRIERVHGLVAAASKMELDPARMSEDRRRKLIETLGRKDAGAPAAVVAMPRKETNQGGRSPWRWMGEVAAALIILAVLAGTAMPRFSGVLTRRLNSSLVDVTQAQLPGDHNGDAADQYAPFAQSQSPEAPASAAKERLAALDALKALASRPRSDEEDAAENFDAADGGVADRRGEEVRNLFDEAKGYEQTGRYDKAYQDYDRILNLDPYNVAARRGQERVNGTRNQYADQAYEDTRSELLWQVDKGWDMPVHKSGVQGTGNYNAQTTDVRHTEEITNKLNSIIIPKLDFRDATVSEALDFLRQKSRDLDTQEPDPSRRGLNIVDKAAPPDVAGFPAPASPAIPGLEAAPGSIPSPATAGEPRLNISLSNIPVGEALKYVAQLSNLKVKIDPDAVSLVPPSMNTEEIVTKEYKLPGGAGQYASGVAAEIASKKSAMDYLSAQGVQFPPGASAEYFPSTKRLVVHDTPDNLELMDAVLGAADVSREAAALEAPAMRATDASGAADAPGSGGSPAAPSSARVYTDASIVAAGSLAMNAAPVGGAAPAAEDRLPLASTIANSGAMGNQGMPTETEVATATAAPAASPVPTGPAEPEQAQLADKANAIPKSDLAGSTRATTKDTAGPASPQSAAPADQLTAKAIDDLGTRGAFAAAGGAALASPLPLAMEGRGSPAGGQQNNIPMLGQIPLLGHAYRSNGSQQAVADTENNSPGSITVRSGGVVTVTVRPSPAPEGELAASDQPYSTFSLHVSDVSFLLASAELANGQMPDPDSIRPEEFYNAFDYGDPAPASGQQIACHIEQAAHPVLQQRNLVRIAMKVAATGRGEGQPLRLTVLLDTSGSMEREDRAASVQRAMEVLISLLGPNDAVTLIGFARQPRLLAEEVPGDQAGKLVDIVKHTPPQGGTNMEEAIKTASELALRHFEKGGQNRVVMLTDGAANLGDADPVQLSKLVDALRQQGVSFDACGVGADGLNDDILEALTRKGGGRYYFLNQPGDADEGFARQLAGAFRPAAENVKMQVRFNPDRVGKYKLIGFEKNRLKQEDFRNDNVTAAQLAAEEAAVALYQVQVLPEGEGEIGEVFVRFRDPTDGQVVEQSWTIPYDPQAPALDKASPSMQLATMASLVAEKLRGGPQADEIDMDALEPVVTSLRGYYAQQTRVQDFATMFEQVRRMTARK